MRTVVVGVGNTILGDDGIGIWVSKYLAKEIGANNSVQVCQSEEAGIQLLDIFEGFQKAVIIDSITTGTRPAGHVYRLRPCDLVQSGSQDRYSSHQLGIATLCTLGKRFGVPMPKEVVIYAVEIARPRAFSEVLTEEIASIVPRVAVMVKRELGS